MPSSSMASACVDDTRSSRRSTIQRKPLGASAHSGRRSLATITIWRDDWTLLEISECVARRLDATFRSELERLDPTDAARGVFPMLSLQPANADEIIVEWAEACRIHQALE